MPRYFAHCETRGCRRARPFVTFQDATGRPMIRTEHGLEDLYNASAFRPAGIEAPMRRRGIWCDEHGPMRVAPLKATHNPNKVCDGRCTSAKRATCDCSCGGAMHGSAY